jgi:hypothetical protein
MRSVTFTAMARQNSGPVELKRSVDLTAEAVETLFHPAQLGKARVDFLLRKIELEGEDAAASTRLLAFKEV